jgi:hypothetical protein
MFARNCYRGGQRVYSALAHSLIPQCAAVSMHAKLHATEAF